MKEIRYEEIHKDLIEYRFSDPDKVLKMAIDLYKDSIKRKDYHYASIAKFYEGDAYLSLDELDKAYEPLLEAVYLQEKYEYVDYICKALNVLGGVFYSLGDYVISMKYLMSALEKAIKVKDTSSEVFICNNIAAVFLIYRNSKMSQIFFTRALKATKRMKKEDDKNQNLLRIQLNQAICLNERKRYAESKAMLDDILLDVMLNIDNQNLEDVCLFVWELAISVSKNMGDVDRAVAFAHRMTDDAKKYCHGENLNIFSETLEILAKNGCAKKAEELLNIMDEVAKKSSSVLNNIFVLKEWINFYAITENSQLLSKCYKQYYDLVQKNKETEIANQLYAIENRSMLEKMTYEKNKLVLNNDNIEKKSLLDSLTGVLNRNGMKSHVDEILKNNCSKSKLFNLAIIDIDSFKAYNDLHGHITGDRSLVEIAKTLKQCENEKIKCGRFGGDEFFLIGNGYSEKEWFDICKKVHERCAHTKIVSADAEALSVTVSIGLYSKIPDEYTTYSDYIHYADIALYRVKKNGRNNCMAYTE